MKKFLIACCFVIVFIVSSTAFAEKIKIGVWGINAGSGLSEGDALLISDMIATEVSNHKKSCKIVSQRDIKSMIDLEASKQSFGSCSEASCLAEIGNAIGINYLVTGSVGKLGSIIILNLQIIRVDQAEVVNRISKKSRGDIGIVAEKMNEFVRELFGAKIESETSFATSEPKMDKMKTLGAVSNAKSAYNFSKHEREILATNGVRFTENELAMFSRMKNRGFTVSQVMEAAKIYHSKNFKDTKDIESIATFKLLNMDASAVSNMKEWSYNVTDYYNYQIGGRGLKIAGWIMFGAGLGGVLLGGILYATSGEAVVGGTYMGLGGLVALIGLPMGIVGSVRTSRWADEELLDSGSVNEMREYKLSSAGQIDTADDGARFAIAPAYTNKGGGLSLLVQF